MQGGVHAPRLAAHRAHRQVFIRHLEPSVGSIELVDRTVDCLADVACQSFVRERRQFRGTLLLQAGAQFGFATALLPVALVALRQLAPKRAVLVAQTGGQEAGNADIHPHRRRNRIAGWDGVLVIGQLQPPAVFAPDDTHPRQCRGLPTGRDGSPPASRADQYVRQR